MSFFCAPPTLPSPQHPHSSVSRSSLCTDRRVDGSRRGMFVSLAVPAVGCLKPARDAIVSRLERSEPCMSGRAAAQTQRDAAEIGWNGGVGFGGCRMHAAARGSCVPLGFRLWHSDSSVSRTADRRRLRFGLGIALHAMKA